MPIPVNKSTDNISTVQHIENESISIQDIFIQVIKLILSSRVVNQDCLLRHEKCCYSSSIVTKEDNSCCIVINILQKDSNYLLERWMMSFDIIDKEQVQDKIEFIENITNFIQQMPSKIELFEMYSIAFLNNDDHYQCYTHISTQERIEFRFNSKLKAKRFYLSNVLSLQVVFDENIEQLTKKPIISLQSLSSPSFISWNKMQQIQEITTEEEVHPLASSPTHMTNTITNHNHITIPIIAVRRLSRLSLSAIQLDEVEEEEEEQDIPSSIPIPSSRMQYTNHRTTLAYSTSPNNISFSPNNLFDLTRRNSTSDHHGCLVGSFEESLLSGRMSSMPSKPITFHCQIGVLGYGDCKPSLKCPPHWNIIFPATFYKLGEEETPYVGTIDLSEYSNNLNQPGYRIPPKGQLQFVIKNPNKTAVKLFLIPYDFNDMPKNTKTFLRQKSYTMNTPQKVLRFAIHIQFFRNEKKRIYLYKYIRIVFSNRKFDSTEKFNVLCEGPKEPVYMSL